MAILSHPAKTGILMRQGLPLSRFGRALLEADHPTRTSGITWHCTNVRWNAMSSSLQLSVIVPHLNEPDDLRRCLRSLAAQRADGVMFEIIVVDNGSTTLPEEECRGIADLRLVRETTPGPGPARNLGARLARAELLAFIDADCVAQDGWAKAVVSAMSELPDAAFAGGDIRIHIAEPGRPTAIEAYEAIYAYDARAYIDRHGFAATGNMAVRKSVFEAVGPFGGIASMEDTDWGQRATRSGYRGVFLADARVMTPPCRSFRDLAKRWDRHVAHEFNQTDTRRLGGMLRWLLRAMIIAVSPLPEILRVLASDRITGVRNRLRAWACLTRVRFYRARRMMLVAMEGDATRLVANWNRS